MILCGTMNVDTLLIRMKRGGRNSPPTSPRPDVTPSCQCSFPTASSTLSMISPESINPPRGAGAARSLTLPEPRATVCESHGVPCAHKGNHVSIICMEGKTLPADCLVYKHSTTCPVSTTAGQEVRAMKTDLPIYWINVREQRELSNWVAETYGVMHQSPQLLLIRGGKVEKVWSHYEVSRSIL